MGLIKNWADVNGTKHQVDPTGHTHSTSESWLSTIVNNLTTLINGKAASVHTHTKSQITDFAHTHSSIVGEYQTEYVRLYNNHVEMQGKLVEIYASDQQGGNINLKVSKEEGGSITASIHEDNIGKLNNVLAGTIPQSDVSGLSSALDGKAASTHTHTKSQITDFDHTHTIGQITNLQNTIDEKEDAAYKIQNWDAMSGNDQYPNAQLVKASLDNKVNGGMHIIIEPQADLDDLIQGDTYFIDNSAGSSTTEVFISTLEKPIHFHQGYAGAEDKKIIFRVYEYNEEYYVEIAGLYS